MKRLFRHGFELETETCTRSLVFTAIVSAVSLVVIACGGSNRVDVDATSTRSVEQTQVAAANLQLATMTASAASDVGTGPTPTVASTPDPLVESETFYNTYYGVSLQYPANWNTYDSEFSLLRIYPPQQSSPEAVSVVFKHRLGGTQTIDDLAEGLHVVREDIQQSVLGTSNYVERSADLVSLGKAGVPAYRLDANYMSGAGDVRHIAYVIVAKEPSSGIAMVLLLELKGLPELVDIYEPDFEQFASTFEINLELLQ